MARAPPGEYTPRANHSKTETIICTQCGVVEARVENILIDTRPNRDDLSILNFDSYLTSLAHYNNHE